MKCKSYNFFSVLSNELRWKIVKSLYKKEMTVSQICQALEEEQSKVSHSLRALLDCNFVFSKRQGKNIIYSLNRKTIRPLIKIVNIHAKDYCKTKCCKKEAKK
ncbi:MAG TPA: metalloregulator ArsR/SmtB family transcription factor [archaeon]|jgi:ArsR family transcriptional regulator|nr:metalloregulator ArsR/SmtB family transcription factor [archaeon]HPV66009.1 metalloregulator ArsR/SmtB family transcription factor [archaeon]